MTFHFGQLIAHLCKTRNVRAGSVVGSGTVSNIGVTKGTGDKARTDWPKGYSCIAEKRAMETIQDGAATTEFMRFGDTIRLEMKGRDGTSVFGAIEQEVVPMAPVASRRSVRDAAASSTVSATDEPAAPDAAVVAPDIDLA